MTGGTIVAALDLLKDRGVANKQIKVVSALKIVLYWLVFVVWLSPQSFVTITVDIGCCCPSSTGETKQEVPRVTITA